MDNFSLPLPHGFSLRDTLLCGQCFRWEENAGGSFTGWAGAHHATLYQQGDTLLVTGSDPDFWEEYLDLREDYDGWKTTFSADRTLSAAIEKCGGIRILRQQPWETVISFIISANNNIPRIRGIIDRLCSGFGEDGHFPTPQQLAVQTPETLAPVRAGFRTKYILDAAQKVADGTLNLDEISSMPLDDARKQLMTVKGIGPKVAECILLYGFHRLDAFPIDTWIKKILCRCYPDGFPEWIVPKGVAQQYLFHYIRIYCPKEEENAATGLSTDGQGTAKSLAAF